MIEEPTADEIMKMFAVDIAVLRRGRRKPSEKPPVGKKKAKASKKPVKLTAEQLAHSTISAVRNRRPTNATTTCFIPRRENGSGRLFETLIQYRLQGWVQPVY